MKRVEEALTNARQGIYTKRRQLKTKQARLEKVTRARDDYDRSNGIKRRSKNLSWTPERVKFKERLNELRAEIRSKAATIARAEEKVPNLQRTLEKAEKQYRKKQ